MQVGPSDQPKNGLAKGTPTPVTKTLMHSGGCVDRTRNAPNRARSHRQAGTYGRGGQSGHEAQRSHGKRGHAPPPGRNLRVGAPDGQTGGRTTSCERAGRAGGQCRPKPDRPRRPTAPQRTETRRPTPAAPEHPNPPTPTHKPPPRRGEDERGGGGITDHVPATSAVAVRRLLTRLMREMAQQHAPTREPHRLGAPRPSAFYVSKPS